MTGGRERKIQSDHFHRRSRRSFPGEHRREEGWPINFVLIGSSTDFHCLVGTRSELVLTGVCRPASARTGRSPASFPLEIPRRASTGSARSTTVAFGCPAARPRRSPYDGVNLFFITQNDQFLSFLAELLMNFRQFFRNDKMIENGSLIRVTINYPGGRPRAWCRRSVVFSEKR